MPKEFNEQFHEQDPMDGTNAAPKSHEIISESEELRILKIAILPGVKEKLHTHKYPSVLLVYSSSALKYYKENDYFLIPKREIKDKPYTEYLDPEGPHAIENVGQDLYWAIRLEIKMAPELLQD